MNPFSATNNSCCPLSLLLMYFGGLYCKQDGPRSDSSLRRSLKGMYYCPIEIINGLTDKGQFQYSTKLKGPKVGNYLYTLQFLSLR